MGWLMGFEPTTTAITIRYSLQLNQLVNEIISYN